MSPASPQLPPSVPKPADVVDRDHVWQQLCDAWARPEPALLLGLGRRRAGKSWVLARFARAVDGVYYQATKRTEAEQLAALSRIIGRHYSDAALQRGVGFAQWEDLLGYLTDRAAGAPFLLVLDEFPYLADAAPALPSILQAAWDHDWPNTRVRLVLNGSHISAMQRLEAHDQPLYGRRTARLHFPPLHVAHVRRFVPQYSARDTMLAYGIFGGLPGHLALLRDDEDLADNVKRLMLDPSGRLADEAEHLLDAFLTDADVHNSVLQAIASGERAWSRITSRVGKPGGSLSRPLRWLEDMHLVARTVPITEDPTTSRRALYSLTDPYIAFWHRFVAPLVASGETSVTSPDLLWQTRVAPRLDDYMGGVFEELCRTWVAHAQDTPFAPVRVGTWWDAKSTNQIDVVALGPNRELLVGECKWGTFDERDLRTLRERTALLQQELPASARGGPVTYMAFSARADWSHSVMREIETGAVIGVSGEQLLSE